MKKHKRPSLDLLIKAGCYDLRQPEGLGDDSTKRIISDKRAKELGKLITVASR